MCLSVDGKVECASVLKPLTYQILLPSFSGQIPRGCALQPQILEIKVVNKVNDPKCGAVIDIKVGIPASHDAEIPSPLLFEYQASNPQESDTVLQALNTTAGLNGQRTPNLLESPTPSLVVDIVDEVQREVTPVESPPGSSPARSYASAATPEAEPAATPEAEPAATPEAAPAATPEAAPAATSAATPEAAPAATSAPTPEAAPAATSAPTPEAAPAAAPAVESVTQEADKPTPSKLIPPMVMPLEQNRQLQNQPIRSVYTRSGRKMAQSSSPTRPKGRPKRGSTTGPVQEPIKKPIKKPIMVPEDIRVYHVDMLGSVPQAMKRQYGLSSYRPSSMMAWKELLDKDPCTMTRPQSPRRRGHDRSSIRLYTPAYDQMSPYTQ